MADHRFTLTDREREILAGLVEGLTNAEIAARLHLGTSTVKWYNSQIYSKLGVNNRDQAVAVAERQGILDRSPEVESIPNNIPAQATPFIGRDKQVAALKQLLYDRRIRLITVLGAGGMGKTRLVLEVAAQLVAEKYGEFADGVFFVSLQPTTDAANIVFQIANSLGIPLMGESPNPRQQLVDALAEERLLLVMDNWEHVLDGATLLPDILTAAPYVRVLATSRERLNLTGETIFSLTGMEFPTGNEPEAVAQYEAVQLFIRTAQQEQPNWQATPEHLGYVARICHVTEGMPLAIILAASWLDTLTVEQIASEIQRSIDFLETEMRDIPERQRSIRAIFDYAWNSLSQPEQRVFMTLGVFRGGFTLQAAQAVAQASPRALQTLVAKALVTRVGGERYDVHALLRQYAEEKLTESGTLHATLDRHAEYFADFVHQRNAALKGAGQNTAAKELEADFENIRMMWYRAIGTRSYGVFYRSADTLCWFCHVALYLTEGEQIFSAACRSLELRLDDRESAHVWCHLQLRLFWVQIWLYGIAKPFSQALERAKRWLDIAIDSGNETDIAICHCFIGTVAGLDQRDDALSALDESLSRFQRLDDPFYAAWTLHFLYFYWESRDLERALAHQRDALALRRELAGPYGLSLALLHVAISELELGDLDAAEACANEVLSFTQARVRYSWASLVVGDVAFFRGDFQTAREESVAAINAYATIRQQRVRGFSHLKIGMIAAVEGKYAVALDLYEIASSTNPNPRYMYFLNWLLALAAYGTNDNVRASAANRYALSSSLKIGAIGRMLWCFPTTALIETQRGNLTLAAKLLSLAFNHPKSITGWLKNWPLMDELKSRLRAALGDDDFERMWNEGAALDPVELVTRYLDESA
ncbi:MAG: AAA family ATPase [Chloroflexi bacterium]|nr:AAA family ATPase [Chloroflexota bacterium]